MGKPIKTLVKLPHHSGTPIHKIRPWWKDVLLRLDPFYLVTGILVLLRGNLFLLGRGWPLSARLGVAVDSKGNPLPWYAYNAIDYLDDYCTQNPNLRVFEYGLGQSTLWWAKRARSVTVVEHDTRWIECPAYQNLPDNVTVIKEQYNSGYEETPLKDKTKFDIIIIDGMNRPACLPYAIKALKKGGVLLWDDSHYVRYQPHIQKLLDDGWVATVFNDHSPVTIAKTQLMIFSRK